MTPLPTPSESDPIADALASWIDAEIALAKAHADCAADLLKMPVFQNERTGEAA